MSDTSLEARLTSVRRVLKSKPLVSGESRIQFEEANSRLKAVRIVRRSRRPLIGSLHRTLIAIGVVVSSYELQAGSSELTEHIVLERREGGEVDADLSDETKAAILRIAQDET